MANSTTEQKEKSKDKTLLGNINARTYNEFMAEDDEGIKRERRLLEKAYELAVKEGDARMIKLLIDKLVPNPIQSLDITSDGQSITGYTFEIVKANNEENN